jgi:hypothetical protein
MLGTHKLGRSRRRVWATDKRGGDRRLTLRPRFGCCHTATTTTSRDSATGSSALGASRSARRCEVRRPSTSQKCRILEDILRMGSMGRYSVSTAAEVPCTLPR